MIIGAHAVIYSADPEADRAFFRDVLDLKHVDVGEGWLIFGLPPSEVSVHPARKNGAQELYLLCKDIRAFVGAMRKRKIRCSPITDQTWGRLTRVTLPGGGRLGVYQPSHERPEKS
jgi:catechol 2,3-dioxygenase-like lactoylglutathione lyase family enzyme